MTFPTVALILGLSALAILGWTGVLCLLGRKERVDPVQTMLDGMERAERFRESTKRLNPDKILSRV